MKLPKQASPVKRPDLIQPYTVIDIAHASKERLKYMRFDLRHGANYNAPMRFLLPV